MDGLVLAVTAAALVIGLTGTWSPCGFSMIETIGPTGHTGGRRTTIAACATFAPGAVAGGVVTFGALGVAGALVHGADGRLAYLIAAALALGAAALEARGAAIVPQVRRQLPEHWRRSMPMPVAAALYGGLLGLGFTTFVLTFGVWAIAAISFAVGEPATGALIGVAFGVGRAAPIIALAPLAGSDAGARVTETMAGRPGLYRGLRLGDALALAVAAAALAGSSSALAEKVEVEEGADPSGGQGGLVYQQPDRDGVLRRGGQTQALPGKDPAMGGPYIAVRDGLDEVTLLDRDTIQPIANVSTPGVNAIAISAKWLAWRAKDDEGRDVIRATRISDPQNPGDGNLVERAGRTQELGMPSVHRARVAFGVASQKRNAIFAKYMNREGSRPLVDSKSAAIHSPSLGEDAVLYVKMGDKRQSVLLKRFGRGTSTVFNRSRGRGILWSTAMTGDRVFVTLIGGGADKILSNRR